jgi:hypothetical protein
MRLTFIFEGKPLSTEVSEGVDRLCWIQIGLFTSVEETHVSLQQRLSVLEAAGISTMFPYED